jgi:hypothetical protein
VYGLAYNGDVVAFKMGRRQGKRVGGSAYRRLRRRVFATCGTVGTRSRAIPGSTSDDRVGCSASDRRWFPARPAQHVHRRRNNGKGRIQSTLASAHGRNGKRRVETYSAGRAGAHPYRRRQSGSVLQAFQNVCIGNQVSCLHEIHGYNRLPWPHPVDPIVRRIKSAGKLFEDRGE